jgi:hypothetical protein
MINLLREHNPPDVNGVDYVDRTREITPSLDSNSPIICENIVLWLIGDNNLEYIKTQCKHYFENSFSLVLMRRGILKEDDIAPQETPYLSIKISLSKVDLENILEAIPNIVNCDDIILHSIDIAQDVEYITTRKDVEEHILANGVERKNIVNDRYKVGDNCISFFNDDRTLKVKVYNKYTQILESAGVTTTLGSRLHYLFSGSTGETLRRTKRTGATRIATTFYGGDLDTDYLVSSFNEVKDFLQGCKFYKTSLEYQWKQLTKKIHKDKVIMVYLEDEQKFAYCHWWNSLTGRMQGGTSKKVSSKEVLTLVANFSFNSTVSKLITIREDETIINEYKRIGKSITLIPGPQGSLYPEVKVEIDPKEIGIIDHKGINIGYPVSRLRKDSAPLTGIEKVGNNTLEDLTDHRPRHYVVSYKSLEYRSKYKVISRGEIIYQSETYLGAEVTNQNGEIVKVRCGPNLEQLIRSRTEKFHFKVTSKPKRTSRGRDIEVMRV